MPLFPTITLLTGYTLTRGYATLSGLSGSVTVSDADAKTTSIILITYTKPNIVNVGSPTVTTKSNGSFVVQSSNVLDSSTFDYMIVN